MATIERRTGKDNHLVYRAKVRRKGHPPQTATFTRRSDALKWIQITEAAILEGRHFKTAVAKRHTLTDLIERYTRDVLPHKGTSIASHRAQQLRWWQAHLGYCRLADLTPARIAEHRDLLSRECRANSTVNGFLAALSHALTVAVKEWGWLDDSPIRKVAKLKEPRGRVRFLSNQERQSLLEACKASKNKSFYTIVVLALATGARQQEHDYLAREDGT
jgi:site-specific recombinase XerD